MKFIPILFSFCIGALPIAMDQEVEINTITPTPFNDNVLVTIENKGSLGIGESLQLRLRSIPIGSNTYSESMEIERMRSNPDGITVLLLVNGRYRMSLTAQYCNPMMEEFRYFNRDCSMSVSGDILNLTQGQPFVVHAIALNSYNESIKMRHGMDMKVLGYGGPCEMNEKLEKALRQPYLLYNQPYGAFDVGENILLDFYLVNNPELSEFGNKVELYIDGQKTATLTNWGPYEITNLPPGEHNIRLVLINRSGKPYESPFPPQESTILVR